MAGSKHNRHWLRTFRKGAIFLIAIIIFGGFQGCGTAVRPTVKEQPDTTSQSAKSPVQALLDTLKVPAGVDTMVALSATLVAKQVMVGVREDSLAEKLFRGGKAERKVGKPLWDLFEKGTTAPQELTADDTLRSIELYNQAISEAAKGDRLLGKGDLSEKTEAARRRVAQHYEHARDLFEQALAYNPWDVPTRDELIRTYQDLADLHRSLGDIDDAIDAIQNYLHLYDESDSNYRFLLGDCYALKGNALGALIQYRWAEDALLSWAPIPANTDFDTTLTALDSLEYNVWINNIFRQCQLELDLGMAESAMADLYRLKASSRGPVSTDSLYYIWAKNKIEWLSWDWGDMEAALLWDQVTEAVNTGSWDSARQLINQLLPMLNAPKAVFDARHLAVQLDFLKLGQTESALEQMRDIIVEQGFAEVNSSLDTLLKTSGSEGFSRLMWDYRNSADSTLEELIDEYGKWCLQYAVEVEEARGDKETAFVYYYQSSLVPWKEQASALFNLAYLSKNQPEKVILYGETAVVPGLVEELSRTERVDLYKLLLNSYRRLNDKPHAEYYYKELVTLQNSPPSQEEKE
jgi:tetratricopeptide (TPR) repeat protein